MEDNLLAHKLKHSANHSISTSSDKKTHSPVTPGIDEYIYLKSRIIFNLLFWTRQRGLFRSNQCDRTRWTSVEFAQWCWCGNWQRASRLVQTQLIYFQCKCYWKMPLPIWTGHLVSTIEAKELSLFISTETGKPIQRRQTLSATLGQYKKEQIGIFPLYLYILDILFHYRNIEFEIFISSQCNGKCNQTCQNVLDWRLL